jgi:hypothetical protein
MARKDRGATRPSHPAHGVTLHGSMSIHGVIARSVGANSTFTERHCERSEAISSKVIERIYYRFIIYSPHVRRRTSPLSLRREGKSIADAKG